MHFPSKLGHFFPIFEKEQGRLQVDAATAWFPPPYYLLFSVLSYIDQNFVPYMVMKVMILYSIRAMRSTSNQQSTYFGLLFFLERTEAFAQHCLHNTLGAEWHWYCCEHAVIRSRVHCYVLHEKCPYSEFFLVRIFPLFRISPYLVRMRENTDQKNSG